MLKIGFFGTPELSASVLRGLLENENFSVEFAVTNPDKKFGRAQTLIASPVKQLAESYKIIPNFLKKLLSISAIILSLWRTEKFCRKNFWKFQKKCVSMCMARFYPNIVVPRQFSPRF